MRKSTADGSRTEVRVLDAASDMLRAKIEENYNTLRGSRAEIGLGDVELAATVFNIRQGLTEALEELARRGYGRVAVLDETDEGGRSIGLQIFRVSQANAALADSPARILARNHPNASRLASCRVGDDIEFVTPRGARYFLVEAIIDLEGMTHLLHERPDIALARFFVANDTDIDIVRGIRDFVRQLEADVAPPRIVRIRAEKILPTESNADRIQRFWPDNWDNVILGNDETASLGAHFFTRTTREQEHAIQTVRGVTLVEGIAGTGKTSVALGRLKFFANFRSGEHMDEYGLSRNDWADFDPSDMVGFVLSPSLVHYLRQTAERLELGAMKIQDFEEYRDQERQSRHLFSRPFKRSPDHNSPIQRTISWLAALDSALSQHVADAIARIQTEPLTRPDTPDGRLIKEERWLELHQNYWEQGPLRARLTGLIRRFGANTSELGTGFRLLGACSSIDRDVRLSDRETMNMTASERRALREAVENVSLRLFRIFNPTELLVAGYARPEFESLLPDHFGSKKVEAVEAARGTAGRLQKNEVTDDDVVTALCLNAISCDGFERDIRQIPYLRAFSERIAVFIDEYQDFSEQQVLLMGYRASRKYRQITVSGDPSQRLHRHGLSDVPRALPMADGRIQRAFLNQNLRQTESLARFSGCIRALTDNNPVTNETPCKVPMLAFRAQAEFAEAAVTRISALPETASVAVISPDWDHAKRWFETMQDGLERSFRNPVLSDRSRLTERFKTHFTTPLGHKGAGV